jgi:hypothetical protein
VAQSFEERVRHLMRKAPEGALMAHPFLERLRH